VEGMKVAVIGAMTALVSWGRKGRVTPISVRSEVNQCSISSVVGGGGVV
jgi:hypothetical protein